MWAVLSALLCALMLSTGGLNLQLSVAVYVLWGVLVYGLPKPKYGMRAVLIAALILRGLLWWTEPIFSNDVFRYVWEGQLTLSGGNPYLTPPSDFQPTASEVHPYINHPHIPSIYPPIAMYWFVLMASISSTVTAMKAGFVLIDMFCVGLIAQIGKNRDLGVLPAWLYALHPLPVIELSGSGHMDGLGILFLLMAFWAVDNQRNASFWLLIGGGVKLLPAILLPRTFRLKDSGLWLALGLMVCFTWPFLEHPAALLTAIQTYSQHWSFNGSFYQVLSPIFGGWTRLILAGLGVIVVVLCLRKKLELCRLALWICGASILLSPTVHPWYVLWAWVPALLCGNRHWTVMATLAPLSYVALLTLDPVTGQWSPPLWPSLVIYGIFGGSAGLHLLQNRKVKQHA
ncbi:MAG: hypothetical protein VXZ96_07635 [Myxococcota bacterium]|nr:hypothetical protein [Myxococcota bacterium]